jgi:hypothetical protein
MASQAITPPTMTAPLPDELQMLSHLPTRLLLTHPSAALISRSLEKDFTPSQCRWLMKMNSFDTCPNFDAR